MVLRRLEFHHVPQSRLVCYASQCLDRRSATHEHLVSEIGA